MTTVNRPDEKLYVQQAQNQQTSVQTLAQNSDKKQLLFDYGAKSGTSDSTAAAKTAAQAAPAASETTSKTSADLLADYRKNHPDETEGVEDADLINILSEKPDRTEEEQALLNAYKVAQNTSVAGSNAGDPVSAVASVKEQTQEQEVEKPKTENEIAQDEKRNEYNEVYSQPGTDYEKTKRVIEKYLNENDSDYVKLSKKSKLKYVDSLIASYREKSGLSDNITPAQRSVMLQEMAQFIIDAGVKYEKINKPAGKKTTAISLSSDELKTKLKTLQDNNSIQKTFKNLKFDDTKSTHDQLFDAVDELLSNDPKFPEYKNLKTKEEKEKKIQEFIDKNMKIIFGFDSKVFAKDADTIETLALSVIKTIQKDKDISLSDLAKSDVQQELIAKMTSSPEFKQKIEQIKDPNIKTALYKLQVKANKYLEIRKEKPNGDITERDMLNKLKDDYAKGLIAKGSYEEQLLKDYNGFEKFDAELKKKNPNAKGILDQTANLSSLATVSAELGKQPKELIRSLITNENGELLPQDQITKNLEALKPILGDGRDDVGIGVVRETLLESGIEPAAVDEYIARITNVYTFESAAVHGDTSLMASITNGSHIYDKDSSQVRALKAAIEAAPSVMTESQAFNYTQALNNTAYSSYGDSFNTGVHKQSWADEYRNNMATSSDVSAERKTAFTESYLKTGTAEQQLHDAKYFSTVKDAAVTEGMAAAEQYVDASVKSQYSQYLDNAIKNNGYTQEQINNINTARETGKTSAERKAEASASSESSKSSSTASSSKSSSSSKAQGASSKTSTSKTVALSTDNKAAAKELRDAIAKAQYADSIEKKEQAQAEIQKVIDKIQNDQKVREQKKAEEAAKQSAITEEAAKAAEQEAKTKSAEKQKSDLSQMGQTAVEETIKAVQTQGVTIPVEKLAAIRSAAVSGQLGEVYQQLASIGAEAQNKFIQILSKQNTSTILRFIQDMGGAENTALIKELIKLNPGLIKALPANMLANLGIEKKDIILYADSHQLSTLLSELRKTGDTTTLNQFYEALGSDSVQYMTSADLADSDVSDGEDEEQDNETQDMASVQGSQEWNDRMLENMRRASVGTAMSTTVSSTRFPDGQTRQRLRPQEIPDYREFIA